MTHQITKENKLDAAEFNTPIVDKGLGFSKYHKYNYQPAWHQTSELFYLLVNGDVWNALPKAQQQAIEGVCRDATISMITELAAGSGEAMVEFQQSGVELRTWPESLVPQIKQAWQQVDYGQAYRFSEPITDHVCVVL